jgi:dienelactone hydrolase
MRLLALMLVAAAAHAQDPVPGEKISLAIKSAFHKDAQVAGELRIPDSNRERLPAVLFLTSSPGFDGRSAFYAAGLNAAGIATLEADMFQGKGLPASARHNLPHVYQALGWLTRHPRIDASRIGIMGVSWGGNVTVLAGFDEPAREFAGGRLRFAAHLALYPGCWKHYATLTDKAGKWADLKPTIYRRATGSPVLILAAGKNDYDERGTCANFVGALPAEARRHVSVTVYPGATFGWDSRFSSATWDASAKDGKGGFVNVVADPALAERSRSEAVGYFKQHLQVDR